MTVPDAHPSLTGATAGGAAPASGAATAATTIVQADDAIVGALAELDVGLLAFQGERILNVNEALCRIVGREAQQILELASVYDLVAPEERASLAETLRARLRGERVAERLTTVLLTNNGGRVHVEIGLRTMVAADAREPGTVFVALVRDVTRARREASSARILADASDIVAAARDETDAIKAIVRLVVPAIADWCAFDRQDLDGGLIRVAAAHKDPQGEELLWELDRRFPVRQFEGNLRARVLRSGAPLVMNGITEASIRATARNRQHAAMLQELGMGAAIWVPASGLGRTVGVMSMGRAAGDKPFEPGDVDLAAKLGHRTAQAIERNTADRTIRARERQQAAVAELGRVALAGTEPDELLHQAARLLAQTLDVEFTSALELQSDGQSLRLVAGVGWPAEAFGPGPMPLTAATQAAYTIASGGPVLVDDLRTDPRFPMPEMAARLEVVSSLSVVIASRGDFPYGVLSAYAQRHRRFSADDAHFVQAVANVLATAIERRESEAALRELDERLHLALAASKTGTWEWDLRSGTLDWSNEVKLLHGLPVTAAAPIFDEYLQIIHPDDRELFQATVGAALGGASYDLDFRLVMPDGEVRWTNGQGRVFADAAGNPVRMVGTARDITDRKETEQERDRLLEQERTARLRREAFIGVLSHELRTPITTVLGGSRILADRFDRMTTEATVDLLNDIGQEAERLARLIEDLLVLSRSERGDIDPRDEPVLPSMVVDGVVQSSVAVRQRVTLDVDVPRNLPIVVGDETYLEQILRNLIGNAAKFSPAGSTVYIRAEATPTEVLLRVLDEGPGIEPHETDQLFEVFYRSPRTKSKAAGSGIGLFVARQLMGAMGGRIRAQPRPEGGAEFGIALRRHEMPAEEREADEADAL